MKHRISLDRFDIIIDGPTADIIRECGCPEGYENEAENSHQFGKNVIARNQMVYDMATCVIKISMIKKFSKQFLVCRPRKLTRFLIAPILFQNLQNDPDHK